MPLITRAWSQVILGWLVLWILPATGSQKVRVLDEMLQKLERRKAFFWHTIGRKAAMSPADETGEWSSFLTLTLGLQCLVP